jgi:Uma2 family endonuclease
VEILSPGTARLDLGRKREIYAQSGVLEFWAVSPSARTVEVYRFRESSSAAVQVLKDGNAIPTPLLPGFALPVSQVLES